MMHSNLQSLRPLAALSAGHVSGRLGSREPCCTSPADRLTPQKIRTSWKPRLPHMQMMRAIAEPKIGTESPPPALADSGADDGATIAYGLSIKLQGIRDHLRLYLVVTDEADATVRSKKIDLSSAKASKYKRDDPTDAGTQFEATIELPANLKPGVALLNKYPEDDKSEERPPFVASMQLRSHDTSAVTEYTAYSYIDIAQGDRVIFPATMAYPAFKGETPAGLQHFREQELQALRGSPEEKDKKRQGAERIYDYDVYNDLADPSEVHLLRPVLGGKDYRYPRRLRTNRGKTENGKYEKQTENGAIPWLPLDERFNEEKFHAFSEETANTGGLAARSVLGTPRGLSFALNLLPFIHQMFDNNEDDDKPNTIFHNFEVVDALFTGLTEPNGAKTAEDNPFKALLPVTRLKTFQVLDILQQRFRDFDVGLKKALGFAKPAVDYDDQLAKIIEEKKKQAAAKVPDQKVAQQGDKERGFFRGKPEAARKTPEDDSSNVEKENLAKKVDNAVGLVHGLLEKWPLPDVREGKAMQWRTDEEFGRQVLAGQNPFIVRALTQEDLAVFAVKDSDVAHFLEGRTLQQGVEDGRLWVLDHHTGYIDYVERVTAPKDTRSILYAGRCVLYTRNNGVTVPVSVELETLDTPMRVFTPCQPAEVWLLAKLVIASLDSGVHQLVSHWLRTHACVEPYIIATRRELSALSPVYKLLEPHFRYTMRINSNARKVLVNAGGIVERSFTPGPYCLQLSSTVYNSWRFDEQGVPQDLLKRQVVEKGEDGKLKSRIPNFPYAEDALEVWDAIYAFAGEYLSLYYNDTDKKVTDDPEVVAWWNAIQKEGHPDIKEGWPTLDTVESLQNICATIMWVSSGHHAAVNFGQYLNSAYMPYMPSMINRKIPDAGSDEEKELRNRFERNLLETLSDPVGTLFVMLTTKILSSHAPDEEYLDRHGHNYIKDRGGVAAHKKFVETLEAAEKRMEARNTDPSKHAYSLLMPCNPHPPGQHGKNGHPLDTKPSGRGIPFSISI